MERLLLLKEYAGKVDGEPCAEFFNPDAIERTYVSCHVLKDTEWPNCEITDLDWYLNTDSEESDEPRVVCYYNGEVVNDYPVHLQEVNPMKDLKKREQSNE